MGRHVRHNQHPDITISFDNSDYTGMAQVWFQLGELSASWHVLGEELLTGKIIGQPSTYSLDGKICGKYPGVDAVQVPLTIITQAVSMVARSRACHVMIAHAENLL